MRILILGGTGMLGHKLWQRLGARFADTYTTIRGTRADWRRFRMFDDARVIEKVNAADSDRLSAALDQASPDVVVNCIALTKRREAATGPAPSILLNAWLPHRLAEWATANDARLITISTDCVFDGKRGGYLEQDVPSADDVYGQSKALGEVDYGNAVTIRTSFIGRELEHGTELLEWFLAQTGKTIKGFRGALYSGISTLYCADVIGDIIETFPQLRGLYQVTSDVISKYELLCLAREAFGIKVTIEPDDTVTIKRNLVGEKFRRATGIVTPHWRAMMRELAADPTPYSDWRRNAV
jgi:dTDP-4-dehydrorhamnose reductase